MRILIADDEPMVRLGIRSMIEEGASGRHTIMEASNGREMLLRAADHPDLAFVDIRMPLLDGIRAIEASKRVSPQTQWVLVTGFSDFSYAQQAIRLGVTDYLLKPVNPEQLSGVMCAAENALRERTQTRSRQFQAELMAYFYQIDLLGEQQAPDERSIAGQTFFCFLLCIDCAEREARTKRMRELTERIAQAFRGKALEGDDLLRYAAFVLPSYDLCLIVAAERAQAQHIHAAVRQIWNERRYPLTVLFEAVPTYSELYAAYERMGALSVLRTVTCFDTCCDDRMPEIPGEQEAILESALCVERIGLAFLSRDELAFRQAIGTLQTAVRDGFGGGVDLTCVLAYLRQATNLPLRASTFSELAASLLNGAQALHRQTTGSNDMIGQIKAYVAAHYMEDIAISTLADEFDITPNYLSKIFHQRAGCTFVSYLSQVRIGIAQKLLSARADMSIREVSEAVGYPNQRHFTKVFAKVTGKNPSAYQSEEAARAMASFRGS